jgi:hypothetical protein
MSTPLFVINPTVETADALVSYTQSLYGVVVVYRRLGEDTYEVSPVGDNGFSTIVSETHLCQAIINQITCFMESAAFIDIQATRLHRIASKQDTLPRIDCIAGDATEVDLPEPAPGTKDRPQFVYYGTPEGAASYAHL